jgi:hypothetical protein
MPRDATVLASSAARDHAREHERFEALLATTARLVRDPTAPAGLAADALRWLANGGLANGGLADEDATALGALGERRLLLYRRHVRRTLERAVRLEIPRTAARLGDAFAHWVNRWIDEEAPRSRYFRDVAFELVAWARPRWAEDPTLPPYLGDLAAHELTWFEVAAAPDAAVDAPPPSPDLRLDRGVRFHASTRLRRYDHAVHTLSEEESAKDEPAREPTALLSYRDADDDVRFLALTPLAAGIVERLLGGEALGPALREACAALGAALDGSVTKGTADLLEDLVARGVILGAEGEQPC